MDILWRILAEIGGFLRGGRPERRCRSGEELGAMPLDAFIERITGEIKSRSNG